MKKNIIKEFCTPDKLYLPDENLNYDWHYNCYPFIQTSNGIVYGDEGRKHNELVYKVIAQLCDSNEYDVKCVANGDYDYLPEGREDWDGDEVQIFFYNIIEEDTQLLNYSVEFWNGNTEEGECYLEDLEEMLYDANDVYEEDAELIVKSIKEGKSKPSYNNYKYYIDVARMKGQLDPYFAINDEECALETLEDILYYTDGDGKYEITDYMYLFGRIWVNVGDNDESYISLWLNNRIDVDDSGFEYLNNGKLDDDDSGKDNTFNVKDANDDSSDALNHVPSSIDDNDIEVCIEVFENFGCDLENSFIAIGDTVLPILKVHSGEERIEVSNDDMKQMDDLRAIHLLPPEEKKETPQIQGFLGDRNTKNNKKLTMYDLEGNPTGVMPMAKYNFYKRYGLGDSKIINGKLTENKNINENMEQYNEFILEWKKWVLKESEALQGGDLNNAGEYHMLANEAYNRYTKDRKTEQQFESKTFGELKTIFENNLTSLFKNKSNIIKEYTNLIKNDKNLSAEHHFFTALQNIQEGNDVKSYINEALELVGNKINYKTINESNKKVNSLLNKYRNELNQDVEEDIVKLAESCNYVLTHKKKISNLNEMNSHLSVIADYATSHLKNPVNESVNTNKLIEDFERKVDSLLNEEEKSFVQEIMNAKKSSDNAKQKKLFEKFKGDCLNQINKMLSESNDVEKEQLLNIKEQLLNKEFCAETLVKDMAKLLEMRDVLMSE